MSLNIFKISYSWYDGDKDEVFLVKDISENDFEKELMVCVHNAYTNITEEDIVCVPVWYGKIIELMLEKNYTIVNLMENIELEKEYIVDDEYIKDKYVPYIIKKTKHIQFINLKCN